MTDKWPQQMRKGLAELCVLAALEHEEGYGYAILKRLSNAASLNFTESTVYPVLARLMEGGDVIVRTVKSDSGPDRRYYRLTEKGRRNLEQRKLVWRLMRDNLDDYLEKRDE